MVSDMKLIKGSFLAGEKVTLEIDGKVIKRAVRYTVCDGLYVVIGGERVSTDLFQRTAKRTKLYQVVNKEGHTVLESDRWADVLEYVIWHQDTDEDDPTCAWAVFSEGKIVSF